MWAIELVQEPSAKVPFQPGRPFRDQRGSAIDVGQWADDALFHKHRIHVGSAPNTILLAPPFIVSDADVDELLSSLSSVLETVDGHCV